MFDATVVVVVAFSCVVFVVFVVVVWKSLLVDEVSPGINAPGINGFSIPIPKVPFVVGTFFAAALCEVDVLLPTITVVPTNEIKQINAT